MLPLLGPGGSHTAFLLWGELYGMRISNVDYWVINLACRFGLGLILFYREV